MFIFKKILIVGAALLLTTAVNFSIANESSSSSVPATEGSLKLVMQGLLANTQQLTSAILTEDFTKIEDIAKNIAEHPKASMETRMKLMKAMGTDMLKFKANDNVVHDAAINMIKNAQRKNLTLIGDDFKTMIGGCVNCHADFKAKVSVILK